MSVFDAWSGHLNLFKKKTWEVNWPHCVLLDGGCSHDWDFQGVTLPPT